MNVFEQKNAELVTEFDRYVREHPDFAGRIPTNALVAMLIEGIKNLIAGVKKAHNAELKNNSRLCT
jgi:hypothetical protein